MKCTKCGKDEAVYEWKNIQILKTVSYQPKGPVSEGIAVETVTGLKDAAMCKRCLGQTGARHKSELKSGWVTLIPIAVIGIVSLLYAKNFFESHPGKRDFQEMIPVMAVLGASVIAIFCLDYFIPRIYARKHPERVARCSESGKGYYRTTGSGPIFVPVGDGMYKDKKQFDSCNSSVSPEMRDKIYNNLIQTGRWKSLAPASDSPQPEPAPAEKDVEIPDASDPDFMSACVERLLQLYRRTPEGFLTSRAGEVREVGRKLDEAGGKEKMLEAHSLFAAQNPRMARNLEMVWDGIGGWMG